MPPLENMESNSRCYISLEADACVFDLDGELL